MLHAIGKKGGGAGKFVWLCFHLNFLVIAQMVKRAFLPHLDFEASQCLAPGLGWVPDWGRKWGRGPIRYNDIAMCSHHKEFHGFLCYPKNLISKSKEEKNFDGSPFIGFGVSAGLAPPMLVFQVLSPPESEIQLFLPR